MYRSKLLALCLIPLSTIAFAGAMGPAEDPELKLSIPDLKPGFGANIAALWLKPGASNLNYVILNKALPLQSPSWAEQELKPDFSAAFELGLRYVFPHAGGKDVRLSWTHLNNSESSMTVAPNDQYFLGPDYQIGPNGIPIHDAAGHVTFKYDVVNLDASQFLDFGQHLELQFFGGLSAGSLREDVTVVYSGNTQGQYPGPFSLRQNVNSDFSGIGPRVGIHADYRTRSGFGFLGEAAAATLIGSLESKTGYLSSARELLVKYGQLSNYQTIKDQAVTQVVPGFSGKLGLDYQHNFAQGAVFRVEAGYQAAVYVNAISQYLPGSLVPDAPLQVGGIFVYTMSHTLSNYSVQGPFLNFVAQL